MSKASDSVMRGLNEALAFANGDISKAIVHQVRVPDVDVKKIRHKTGLTQTEFSRTIGVAKGTLLGWEQGRRTPTGPAMVLLAMLDKDPLLVSKMLISN
ncbi:helix-turn-helix domain-containing protein [Aristophania vespae]|uniref:helix-turn-helix domain-containing protein n=1 Tax=Aristophania vespae TaxID=2697033 RepID=UPI0023512636|nr:helix-turn-helix domain-containing protein [Aristophania vespae]UMM63083.1 hypothetical protein DM15PD_00370 [Aristophania vespae]